MLSNILGGAENRVISFRGQHQITPSAWMVRDTVCERVGLTMIGVSEMPRDPAVASKWRLGARMRLQRFMNMKHTWWIRWAWSRRSNRHCRFWFWLNTENRGNSSEWLSCYFRLNIHTSFWTLYGFQISHTGLKMYTREKWSPMTLFARCSWICFHFHWWRSNAWLQSAVVGAKSCAMHYRRESACFEIDLPFAIWSRSLAKSQLIFTKMHVAFPNKRISTCAVWWK
jgi:hypothetical protein